MTKRQQTKAKHLQDIFNCKKQLNTIHLIINYSKQTLPCVILAWFYLQ